MKTVSIAVMSFLLGAILSGVLGFKLVMATGYEAVIGKLTDNVIYYRQIEQGNPELTQSSIASSLDWFIDLADDGEKSIWIAPTDSDRETLAKAKQLKIQLTQNR